MRRLVSGLFWSGAAGLNKRGGWVMFTRRLVEAGRDGGWLDATIRQEGRDGDGARCI